MNLQLETFNLKLKQMTEEKTLNILVPTDFSDTCQNAINHAVNHAKISGHQITILHVINKETRSKLKKEGMGLETVLEKLQDIQQDILANNDIGVNYMAKEGSIFDVIQEVAKEIQANLMILGTHGKKGLQYLFGGWARKVVVQSPCPVLVVQEKTPMSDYSKVLFPVNVYTEPRQQLPAAIRVAEQYHSTFHIYLQKFMESFDSARLDVISAQIEEEFKKHNIKFNVESAEKQQNFTGQLLSYAGQEKIDMIIMMTDGRIDEPDFSNSSWSEKLIYNEAAIPVLCINPVYLSSIYYF